MISVIVPVYNSVDRIKRCLDSILGSAFPDIEVIVIDDGSNDGSVEAARGYEELDKRVVVYTQENHGVSYTRNRGIDLSKGKYIAFVDSDDYVEKEYFAELAAPYQDEDIQLSICSYQEITRNLSHVNCALPEEAAERLKGNFIQEMYDIRRYLNGPWMKLYLSEIIKRNNVRFPVGISIAEDQIFNYEYYKYVKKYRFINHSNYVYVRMPDSLTSKRTAVELKCEAENLRHKQAYLAEHKVPGAEYILAETICCTLQRYVKMQEDGQSFRTNQKLIKENLGDIPLYDVRLESRTQNIIYKLYRSGLYFVYYYLARLKAVLLTLQSHFSVKANDDSGR